MGFDEVSGALPRSKFIQNKILDKLSIYIIDGKIKEGDCVNVVYDRD